MIDRTLETLRLSSWAIGIFPTDELHVMLRPAEVADEVLLDFSDVTFIDASVLGTLVGLLNRVVARNRFGTIRIVGASRQVTRIFEMCQLQTLFGLSECMNAARVGTAFVKSPVRPIWGISV